MVWRGYLDLPGELEGKLPRIITEMMVALAAIVLAVGLRLLLDQFVPGVVPFAISFPIIAAATLIAGARAGAMVMLGCQLLVWYAVMPPQRSFAFESLAQAVSLLLATLSQIVMILAIAAYRGTITRLEAECRQRIADLSLALREIDHRTKNNFQLAVGLLDHAQGQHDATAGRELAAEQARVLHQQSLRHAGLQHQARADAAA